MTRRDGSYSPWAVFSRVAAVTSWVYSTNLVNSLDLEWNGCLKVTSITITTHRVSHRLIDTIDNLHRLHRVGGNPKWRIGVNDADFEILPTRPLLQNTNKWSKCRLLLLLVFFHSLKFSSSSAATFVIWQTTESDTRPREGGRGRRTDNVLTDTFFEWCANKL